MSNYSNNLAKVFSRLITKHSSNPGETPTIPSSSDHTDGSWSNTDLYTGELFLNTADERAWFRNELSGFSEVMVINTTGTTTFATGSTVDMCPGGLLKVPQISGCSGTVDVSGDRITSVSSPTNGTDAANKDYVDNNAGAQQLSDLSDASSSNPSNNQLLQYDNNNNEYVNTTNVTIPGIFTTKKGVVHPIRKITNNDSAKSDDHTIIADTSSNAVTITLPSPTDGKIFVLKNDGTANNDLTIDTAQEETTIEDASTYTLDDEQALTIQGFAADNDYKIISKYNNH